jgi:hypothetical protein
VPTRFGRVFAKSQASLAQARTVALSAEVFSLP